MKTDELLARIEEIRWETAKRGGWPDMYCTLNRIRDMAFDLETDIRKEEK